jgi:hypothetical protein
MSLAKRSGALSDVSADGQRVFWTERTTGNLMRAEADGTLVTVVADGLSNPTEVISHGDSVFVMQTGDASRAVVKVAKAGGTSTPVISASNPRTALIAAGYLYVASSERVQRVAVGGGEPSFVQVGTAGAGTVSRMAASSTHLYLVNATGVLHRVPLEGGDSAVVSATVNASAALAVDPRHVYYAHMKSLMRCDHDGANQQLVFDSMAGEVTDIELDEGWIYFSVGQNIYRIGKQ